MKKTKFTNKKIGSKPQIKIRNLVMIFVSIFIGFGSIAVFAQVGSLQISTSLTNAVQTIQKIIITNDTNTSLYEINSNGKGGISINLDKLDGSMKKTVQNMPNNRGVVGIDTDQKNLIIIPQNQFSGGGGGGNTTVGGRDYILGANKIVQSFGGLGFGFDALGSFQIDSLAADPSLPPDPLATDRCVYVDNNGSLYAAECGIGSYDACLSDPTLCELTGDICTIDPTLCEDICTTDPTLCVDPCTTDPTLCELTGDICTIDPTLCEDICTTDPSLCGAIGDNLGDHIAMQNIQLGRNGIVYSDGINGEPSTNGIFTSPDNNVSIGDLDNMFTDTAKLTIDGDIKISYMSGTENQECSIDNEGVVRYMYGCFQGCDGDSRNDIAGRACSYNYSIEQFCLGDLPNHSIPTATSRYDPQGFGVDRTYQTTPGFCTFVCQAGYTYNGATCNWVGFSGTTINNLTGLVQNIINNMTGLTINNITGLVQNIVNNMTGLTINNITGLVQNIVNNMTGLTINNITGLVQNIINNYYTGLTINNITGLVQNIVNNMTGLTINNITGLVQNIVNNMTLSGDNLGNHTATTGLKLNNNRLSNDGGSEGIKITNSGFVGIGLFNPNNTIQVKDLINFNGNNTFLGYQAGVSYIDTMYDYLTAIGYQALFSNTSGFANTAIGYTALYNNTIGGGNTAIGHMSLHDNTTGWYNTAIGIYALSFNLGNRNTAVGDSALEFNTIGSQNTAIGVAALYANISGDYNTAIGMNALVRNKNGDHNTAIGMAALYSNVTGSNNTAIGKFALFSNITGSNNTAIGAETLINNTGGQYNTAIGSHAGRFSSGSYNVFIGNEAGYNETGDSKLYIANSQSSTLIYGDFQNKKVGINTTSPTDALDVSGSIRSRNLAGNGDRCLYTNSNGVILATGNCNITAQTNGTSSGDNLGNHTATTGLRLNNNRISNDGDNEGIMIDNSGNVLFSKSSITGLGTRFMRLPGKSALRVGTLNSSTREETNIGNNSVVFGKNNKVQSTGSSILGGLTNRIGGIYSDFSSIVGGELNFTMSHHSIIGGGYGNNLFGDYSIIGGGYMNTGVGLYTTIGGGNYNSTMGQSTTIGGGSNNNTQGNNSTIGGGESNNTQGNNSTIGGGVSNRGIGSGSTIGGGIGNAGAGFISLVGGGQGNRAKGNYSSVVGGYSNTSNGTGTIIGGGGANTITGNFGVIGGGNINKILGDFGVIGGGISNSMIGNYGFIGGGRSNKIYSGDYGVIIGGTSNTLTGNFSIILGGSNNSVNGIYSVAAGRLAQVNHDYTALFNLSSATTFSSAKSGTFIVNAPNGFGINTNDPSTTLDIDGGARVRGLSNTGNYVVYATASGDLSLVSPAAFNTNNCSNSNSILKSAGNKNSACSQAYATNIGVGVGISDPLYKFQVEGSTFLNGRVSINSKIDNNAIFRVSVDQFNTSKTVTIKKLTTVNSVCQKSQCTITNSTYSYPCNPTALACQGLFAYTPHNNKSKLANNFFYNLLSKAYAVEYIPPGVGQNPPAGCPMCTYGVGQTVYTNTCSKFDTIDYSPNNPNPSSNITCIYNETLGGSCAAGNGSTNGGFKCYYKNQEISNFGSPYNTGIYTKLDSYVELNECGIELSGSALTTKTYNYLGTRNKPLMCRGPMKANGDIDIYVYELSASNDNSKLPALTVNTIGGNVGIKKPKPLYTLDVLGDINTDGFIKVGATATSCNQASDAGKIIYLDQCFCGCVGPYGTNAGEVKTGRVAMGGLSHCSNICNSGLQLKLNNCGLKLLHSTRNSVSQLLSYYSPYYNSRSETNTGSSYNSTASSTSCRYICNPGYTYSNGSCVETTDFNYTNLLYVGKDTTFTQSQLGPNIYDYGSGFGGGQYIIDNNTITNDSSAYINLNSNYPGYKINGTGVRYINTGAKPYLKTLDTNIGTINGNINTIQGQLAPLLLVGLSTN